MFKNSISNCNFSFQRIWSESWRLPNWGRCRRRLGLLSWRSASTRRRCPSRRTSARYLTLCVSSARTARPSSSSITARWTFPSGRGRRWRMFTTCCTASSVTWPSAASRLSSSASACVTNTWSTITTARGPSTSLRSHGGEAAGPMLLFTITRPILVFVLKLPIFCADVLKNDPLNHHTAFLSYQNETHTHTHTHTHAKKFSNFPVKFRPLKNSFTLLNNNVTAIEHSVFADLKCFLCLPWCSDVQVYFRTSWHHCWP